VLEFQIFDSDSLSFFSLSVSKSSNNIGLSVFSDKSEKSGNLLSEGLKLLRLCQFLTLILESLATAVPLTLVNLMVCNSSGDWGLGIGDWAPQSPIPNPQSPFYTIILKIFLQNLIKYIFKNSLHLEIKSY
jgi:hypothetical protein